MQRHGRNLIYRAGAGAGLAGVPAGEALISQKRQGRQHRSTQYKSLLFKSSGKLLW
jgi:hypothetical protein